MVVVVVIVLVVVVVGSLCGYGCGVVGVVIYSCGGVGGDGFDCAVVFFLSW